MDSYFPKTRRPIALSTGSLKRPPSGTVTPPKPAKIPATPTTPEDARLTRPLQPPPVKRKSELHVEAATRQRVPAELRNRPFTVKELFKSARPLNPHPQRKTPSPLKLSSKSSTPTSSVSSTSATSADTPAARLGLVELRVPVATSTSTQASPIKTPVPVSPNKISSGPLKGVSTSLLDLIRAREAAAKATTPEQERQRELLGIAPEVVRIVPTVFTANKREVMLYDKVIEKCFKGLKSNYTTATIIECIDLMDKVAPEWISTVKISRGKFMRINREKYTLTQLLGAIRRYKTKNC